MGRSRLPSGVSKDVLVQARVTRNLALRLRARAMERGMTVSQAVREALAEWVK